MFILVVAWILLFCTIVFWDLMKLFVMIVYYKFFPYDLEKQQVDDNFSSKFSDLLL